MQTFLHLLVALVNHTSTMPQKSRGTKCRRKPLSDGALIWMRMKAGLALKNEQFPASKGAGRLKTNPYDTVDIGA
jgi:hypothetical protein